MGVKTSNQITISNVSDARAVTVTATSQIFKSVDGGATFSPDTIQITPVFQGGISYSKWQYSLNGGRTWTDISSGAHGLSVSSGVLTIAKTCDLYTDSVTSISFKCLSSNPDFSAVTTITKLYDVTNLLPEIEETKTTISGIETKVDNNTKAISTKATKTDITDSINSYDGSTVNAIRETVATHTTKIGEIQSNVTDVETKVEEKADGSMVETLNEQVSEAIQDASLFKQTVSSTYATKSDLDNSIKGVSTEFMQKADSFEASVKKTLDESQTALRVDLDGISGRVEDAEKNIGTVTTTAAAIVEEISNARGDKASLDVTINEINGTISDAAGDYMSIGARLDGITNTVSECNGNYSKISQTADEINLELTNARGDKASLIEKLNEISTTLFDAITEATTSVTQTANDYTISITKTLQEQMNIISKSFKFTQDGLIISASGTGNSNIALRLGNDKISFLDGNTEVAYISNNKLHITSSSIVDSLQIGNFGFTSMTNGSLSFNKLK